MRSPIWTKTEVPRQRLFNLVGWRCPNRHKGEVGHASFTATYRRLVEEIISADGNPTGEHKPQTLAEEMYEAPVCETCGERAKPVRAYRKKGCPVCGEKIPVGGAGRTKHLRKHVEEEGLVELREYPMPPGGEPESFWAPRDQVNTILRQGSFRVVKK